MTKLMMEAVKGNGKIGRRSKTFIFMTINMAVFLTQSIQSTWNYKANDARIK